MSKKPLTSPRKNATQDRSKATIDTLLAATARVLVKEGYDRASTNKIAIAAGVSIGSLYQYFPSKEALVAAVIDRHMATMMETVRASFSSVIGLPLPEVARELVKVMITAHRIEPKLHRVLVEQIPRVGNLEAIEGLDREACSLVRAYLETQKDHLVVKDLDVAAFCAVISVEALTHAAVLRRPSLLDEDGFIDEVASLVVRYLTGKTDTIVRR